MRLYSNLFSPKEYENNDKIILKYFQQLEISFIRVKRKKIYRVMCKKYKEFKNPKIYIHYKTYFFLVFQEEIRWRY